MNLAQDGGALPASGRVREPARGAGPVEKTHVPSWREKWQVGKKPARQNAKPPKDNVGLYTDITKRKRKFGASDTLKFKLLFGKTRHP